jgi:uncharacterized membrane protein YkoI
MMRSRNISTFTGLALAVLLGSSALAQDYGAGSKTRSLGDSATAPVANSNYGSGGACLSSAEGRKVIQDSGAISLAAAAKAARDVTPGEIVDYKICSADAGYSYVLTILARDGKVARAWVDAASGKLVTVR